MRGVNIYMTVNNSEGDKDASKTCLKINENDFSQALGQLNSSINDLKNTNDMADRQEVDAAQQITNVANALLRERVKVTENDQSESQNKGGYALDFDSARDEIGRRMARLRAAI